MRFSRPVIAAFGAAMLTALPLAASAAQTQSATASIWHSAGTVAPVNAATEPVYGQPSSDFSLIVWVDPECPYCKVLGRTPEAVVDASGAKVNLAMRLLPLPMHGRAAFIAAASALCVGQQVSAAGYYRFLDSYMERTQANGAGLPEGPGSSVDALARAAGVTDIAGLDRCVHAPETIQLLGSAFDAAREAGVTGTPAIVVRDNRTGAVAMAEGALDADEITRMIHTLGARAAD